MPEKIVRRSRNFSPNLYFDVPFSTKVRYSPRRGGKIVCTLQRILDSSGKVICEVNEKIECDILKRDGRFYLPPELVQRLNLFGGEHYEIILHEIIRPDGKRVEIYPGETRSS
jgi:hypothetical protein